MIGGSVVLLAIAQAATPAASSPAACNAPCVRFDFDNSHTYIGFNARHMMVTNVKGRFNRFTGYILMDTVDITRSTVHVEIDVASVDTENQRRDDDLRSERFFNAAAYPKIVFEGTSVEQTADGTVLVGSLTIRDVTKEVRIPFELIGPLDSGNNQKRLGVEATLRLNRLDYGVRYNRVLETGGVLVSDEVRLELNVEARTPQPARRGGPPAHP